MQTKKDHLIIFVSGLFLFILDRLFKYFAFTNQEFSFVWKTIIGWEFYANNGIAFNIPFPNLILLVFTPIIIFALFVYYLGLHNKNTLHKFAIILIILGAASNFVDRILFGITIDYFKLLTAVINLADAMIIIGVLLLLKSKK